MTPGALLDKRAAAILPAMKTILALVLLIASLTLAQAQSMPFVWPRTVGTSSASVLPANNARKRVMFVNPNATAIVAVCPTISRVNSAAIVCTVNGAGSITILPYASIQLDNVGSPTGTLPSAWNAIASSGGAALTIFEWE